MRNNKVTRGDQPSHIALHVHRPNWITLTDLATLAFCMLAWPVVGVSKETIM